MPKASTTKQVAKTSTTSQQKKENLARKPKTGSKYQLLFRGPTNHLSWIDVKSSKQNIAATSKRAKEELLETQVSGSKYSIHLILLFLYIASLQ